MAKTIIIPDQDIAVRQAVLISQTNRTQLLKPVFFKVDADEIAIEQGDIADKTSWLGTPVYDAFIFNAFSYTDANGVNVNIADSFMLDAVLITVHQPKNIVKTKVAGRNGTVKEYISDDDYDIRIQGMIVGRHANIPPPITDKIRLMEILKAPVTIPVSCNFMDMFNISSIVIEDFEFSQIEGTRNAIGVSITAYSDEPFEIRYTSAKDKFKGGSTLSFQ